MQQTLNRGVNIRDIRHRTPTFPTAAPQQPGNTITLQQALARGITAHQLRAVANWNERKSRGGVRSARPRHYEQAIALRAVADELERGQMREAA
jgi:hypothetical protein